jgi:hypothetical protein
MKHKKTYGGGKSARRFNKTVKPFNRDVRRAVSFLIQPTVYFFSGIFIIFIIKLIRGD